MTSPDTDELLPAAARDFATTRVQPIAGELDETERFPAELYEEMGALGMFGVTVPAAHGGVGASTLDFLRVMEAIAHGYASVADQVGLVEIVGRLLSRLGTDEQRDAYLPPLLAAERRCCYALTEPEAGSDLGNVRTRAEPGPRGWRLTGEKIWIHNAPVADFALVLAVTDPSAGKRGMSLFLVDLDAPGVTRGPKDHKMGQRASPVGSLGFTDVELAPSALLGEEGAGFRSVMQALDSGRVGIAGLSLGIGRRASELAREHALSRVTFGRPLAEHQAVAFRLADMATEHRAARLLAEDAAARVDQGGRQTTLCSMAKLHASEAAIRHTSAAVQTFGGSGFIRGFEVERLYRDARITTIYEGTSDMQRLVIARGVADDPRAAHRGL